MKSFKSLLRACSMLLLASFSASLTHAQATVRILPLGDSLTAGYSNGAGYPGAYRNKLYTLLTNAGYPLDYVGTNTEPNNPTIPDTNNQGMGGFRIDQIQSGLDGWLSSVADPDVILLLIGTNDFLQGYNISTAPARLESLIADIATKRPFAKIIVSNLPVRSDPTQDSQEITFNAAIPGIVSNQVSLGRQVSMINIRPTLTTADLFDGIHPTQTGYEKIADVWFPAITNVIAPTGTANLPAIARVIPQPSLTQLTVTFSKPVADSAATLANFSINNGLSISQAVLDSSKRTVTLTTSAQSAGVVYTLSVNGVRDRTPSQNLIAAGANALFATNAQANGSFESDFAGWTSTGNMLIKSAAPYAATNGSKLVAFATAQSTPNGVLSQSFATTPGQTYQLAFDAGVFGEIVQQRLQVSVTGTSSVLSQTLTLTGPGGNNTNWLPQSFAFTANSAATTLTFTDVSTTSINADLVLDNVRLTPQLVSTITLTSSPSSGASIGLSPADVNGNSTGTTGFPRSYVNGTTVILTAPATFGGSSFLKWQKNGSDISSNATTSVLVDGSYTFNAVYGTSVVSTSLLTNGSFESGLTGWTPTGNLRATVAGASTQGTSLLEFNGGNTTPNGVISQSFPTTIGSTYTLAFDAGVYSFNTSPQRLQVNVTGSGSLFSQLLTLTGFGNGTTKWFPQSFTFVANSATTTLSFTDTSATTSALDLYLDNVRVTGPPVTQRTLTVASAPTTGVSFTVSPNDVNGASNGITQFTRTYNDGAVVNLTAPATSGANNFSKWQKDGIDYSATAATSVTMSSSFTMTAVYTAPVIAPGTLVNGSFESNETGWTMTGNRLAYSSDGSYVATNGQKLLVLSGGTATPDAVVSQSFNTTPGQSYQLSFDVGSLAVNTAEQRLKVDVAGTASLVSQTESVFGNGAGNSSWTAKTYNFTADSATTTLTFSDLSPVTAGIDLLLDNVVVALAGPAPVTRTLTVASSPATGVSITLSPNDLSANGNGTTQFTRTYNDGTVVSLTAPATSGSSTFSKWQKDGADFSVTAATSVTLSANTTLTAVYTTPAVLPGSLVNGSFESGETGWTMTGNRLAYASDGSYVATDGTKLLVLSGGTATPNAVISQSITTTVGQTYQLSFDVGSLAVNTAEQRLKVDVAGTVSRLSQTESVFGNNSGTSVWVSKTYTFTADSTSTTLTFSDISPTSAGIDLLLDNVKIQLPGGPTTRTLTVASSPATGVGIIVSPNDLSATGNGTTQFTRTYNDGAVVSLTAPATFGSDNFVKWQKDGVDFAVTAATSVTLTANVTLTAVYAPPPVNTVTLVNGSFENNFAGWTTSGNVAIQSAAPYLTTDGTKLAAFNSGNTTPNGVLSQAFATTPGVTYTLAFDAGAFAFNTSQQRIQVNATGSGSLLSQTITITGLGGSGTTKWTAQSFTFVANSTNTTLSFTDVSTTGSGLDLVLDNVRITGPQTQRTLSVASAVATGAAIVVTPNDLNAAGNGTTPFNRTYSDGAVVSLTAPLVSGANTFTKWQKNSLDFAVTPTTSVTMDANHTLTAVYIANLAPVAVADSYNATKNVLLIVPATGVLTNDTDPESNTLTAVVDTNPTHGTLNLNTTGGFSYTPALDYTGPDSFTYHAIDGTFNSNIVTVSITVNAAAGTSLVNGSFESGEAGWNMTGNRIAYESDGTYVATNGTKLIVLSGGSSTPDAVISQTISTTVGTTYTLTFDIGTVAFNNAEQRLFVSVSGNGTLLSELASVFGTSSQTSQWTTKTYTFVADSTSTTLTFSDLSPTSSLIDLLLDNVAISGPSGPVNTPPVAVADSYTATQNTALVVAAASGVLANDTDTESNALTAAVVAGPASGTLVLNPNGGFTYTPNTGFTGPDSFTYKANDGNSNSSTATVSITVNPGAIGILVNGSFESNFAGWTTTGNIAIQSAAPYVTTDGTKLAAFNAGNTAPNGILTQTFATVPGQTYTLAFDAGAFAYNTSQQRIQVNVTGSGSLLSQAITITGLGGSGTTKWSAQSFTFVANSSSTTLGFTDTSTTGSGLDLVLDNVRVTGPPAVNTAPVAVADSYTATQNTALVVPSAGVLSNDTDAQGNSLTAISVGNPTSGTLSLSANGGFTYTPNIGFTGPDSFTYKANDGLLDSNVVTVSITVNATAPNNQLLVNGSFESNFNGWTTTGNQFIETAAPYSATDGTKLAAFNGGNLAPNAVLSQSFATVTGQSYTLAFDAGVLGFNTSPQKLNVTVNGTASLLAQDITINGLGNGTTRWVAQSFTFVADRTVTTLTFKDQSSTTAGTDLTLDNVRVNGPPGVPNTAPVATGESYSTPQGTALVVAAPGVLANDTDAELSPLTATVGTGPTHGTLTLNPNGGFTYTPAGGYSGPDSFTYVANDGVLNSNTATVSLTVTAVSVGGLANGSFESGETAWSFSGNYLVYPSDGTYVAFNGTNVVVLNGGGAAPNAVISQSFATTPGSTYNLGFALGTVGGNGVTQSLQVNVTGTSGLLSQTQSVTGTSSTTTSWTPQTLSFTANSPVTTLTFTDVSPTTNAVDLLLDNVTVTLSGAVNTAPVAVADSYSTNQNTPLTIAAAGVLSNDTDANSDPLTAVLNTTTTSGTLALNANGGFTYTPNSGFTGTDSFTYHANDTAADSNVVTVTISVSTPAGLVNGSFESDFTGWTVAGNVAIQSASPYLPTNGSKLAAFNSGNTSPNGVLSQTFATVSGTTYTLAFDAGALAYNTSTQRLQVNVTGSGSLLSQLVTPGGIGGGNNNWTSKSFTFVANSATTTLSFTDTSTTGNGIDLLLDKVSITGPAGPAPTTATLTVSSTPATGVSITVSPVDNATLGNGTTSLTRTYNTGTVVSLTAPATSGVANFVKWQKDSVDYAVTVATTVTMDVNHTMTAVYQTVSGSTILVNGSFESDFSGWTKAGNVNIESTAPYTFTDGVKLAGFNGADSTPNGVLSQTFATTPGASYILTFDAGVLSYNTNPQKMQVGVTGTGSLLSQTVTITRTSGSNNLWLPQTFSFVANSATSTVSFTDTSTTTAGLDLVLDNVKVVVNGSAPVLQTLTVASTQAAAVSITASPNDFNGGGNGTTDFGRAYSTGTVVSLTAPGTASGGSFLKWQKDGVDYAVTAATTVTMDTAHTMTAVYNPPPPAGFANGSFESDLASWTSSGSLAIQTAAPYVPTNGSKLLSFNASNGAPNGVLSQAFVTTAGVSYILNFDAGVLSFAAVQQKLQVAVTGTGSLLSQVITLTGNSSGTSLWTPQSFSFTANSSTTTITFTDISASTANIDLLLDNVSINNANTRTLTVASAVAGSVPVTVSPADNNGASDGTAQFTRSYNLGTSVSLTAPGTASNGATFVKWVKDGQDQAFTPATSVTISASTTMVAVYSGGTFAPLGSNILQNASFESLSPEFAFWARSGSVRIEQPGSVQYPTFRTDGNNTLSFNVGGPADGVVSQSFTTTPGTTYTIRVDQGTLGIVSAQQTLRTTVTGNGTLLDVTDSVTCRSDFTFVWVPRTYTFTANSTTTILYFADVSTVVNSLDMYLDNVRVQAGTLPPAVLTVNSTPVAGKVVTASPADLAGQGNGTSNFTRNYATGTTVNLVAPYANFVKWLKDGVWYATNPTISLLMDGSHTFTAVYTTTPVLGPFTNGSFESEFTGWTWSGSQQSVKVKDGLTTTDGLNVIEFNSNSSANDGSITQTFTTTPGTAYTVAFDMGVNAFNTAQQSMKCQVTGTGTLASQTFSMNNPAANGILYAAKTVTFTANSSTSTLTFSDQSATGAGLDLLLDNVRVTAQVPNPGSGSDVVVNAPVTDTPVPQFATETTAPVAVTSTTSTTSTATPPKTITSIKVINGKKYLVLTVVKASLPAGASPVIEVSSDLKTWFSGNAYTTVLKNVDKVLTVRDNTPVRPTAKRYIRLKPIAR